MNNEQIQTRLFQRTGVIHEDMNALENLTYFRENKGYQSNRDLYRSWFQGYLSDRELALSSTNDFHKALPKLPVSLTLMPQRRMSHDDLYRISVKFVDVLNRVVYKNAYKRYDKKITTLFVIEGEKSLKSLHTHFAFSLPDNMNCKKFFNIIHRVVQMNDDFLFETEAQKKRNKKFPPLPLEERYHYKIDIADTEWLGYITKELNTKQLDRLYFQ
ncbi:hypothetical protein [Zwartia panacis]|uniref:hypothetical protein n=1 Tax=Zwartia panacis TaxID=2683345 RepID=UPI0025B2B7FE|nr:hypothetical protein [Zwartia panacis]MDN4018425.1 hypothetical protein [Zwartia panacis]